MTGMGSSKATTVRYATFYSYRYYRYELVPVLPVRVLKVADY